MTDIWAHTVRLVSATRRFIDYAGPFSVCRRHAELSLLPARSGASLLVRKMTPNFRWRRDQCQAVFVKIEQEPLDQTVRCIVAARSSKNKCLAREQRRCRTHPFRPQRARPCASRFVSQFGNNRRGADRQMVKEKRRRSPHRPGFPRRLFSMVTWTAVPPVRSNI